MSGLTNAVPTPWAGEIYETNPRRPLGSGHRALGRALIVLLASSAGLSVLKVMLDLYGMSLFSRWEADPESIVVADGESFDLLDAGLVGLNMLVMLATCIVTMTWLYQAYGSREADPAHLPFKRWWTIGGWLIPFICLVRPFQLIRDLHRATASAQPEGQPDASVKCPTRFRWWWACWLIGNWLSNSAFMYAKDEPSVSELRTAVSQDLVIEVIMIAAALLFIGVVRSISSNLWRRANAWS